MNTLRLSTFAAAMLVSASAFAQNAAPQGAGGPVATPPPSINTAPNRPAPQAGAPQATGPVLPTTGQHKELTPAMITAINATIRDKETKCAAKGRAYRWDAPHAPGDVSPSGRVYKSASLGGCRMRPATELMSMGLLKTN